MDAADELFLWGIVTMILSLLAWNLVGIPAWAQGEALIILAGFLGAGGTYFFFKDLQR